MFIRNNPAGRLDALRLVSEEAAGVNHFFQFRRVDAGEVPSGLAPIEEGRRDLIHHLVRALRR